jgi:predicted secreted protein
MANCGVNSDLNYGGDLILFVSSGCTSTNVEPIAYSTSATLNVNVATRDVSSKDSTGNFVESLAAKISWDLTTDGLTAYSLTGNTTSVDDLFGYMIARVPVYIAFAGKTGTAPVWTVDTDVVEFTGYALITSLSIVAGDNDNSTYSISLVGSSALTMTTPTGSTPTVIIPNLVVADANASTTILIDFDRAMADPALHLADFSVSVNSADVSLVSVALDTDTSRFLLTLATGMTTGDTVTLTIVSGNIQSGNGGLFAGVTSTPVTMSFVVPITPVVSLAATKDANAILVVFNTHLEDPSANAAMFDLFVGGSPVTVTGVILNPIVDTGVIISTSATLVAGNVITFSIDAAAVTSKSGGTNATITSHSVVNLL